MVFLVSSPFCVDSRLGGHQWPAQQVQVGQALVAGLAEAELALDDA